MYRITRFDTAHFFKALDPHRGSNNALDRTTAVGRRESMWHVFIGLRFDVASLSLPSAKFRLVEAECKRHLRGNEEIFFYSLPSLNIILSAYFRLYDTATFAFK
jgi:hypothetical protein